MSRRTLRKTRWGGVEEEVEDRHTSNEQIGLESDVEESKDRQNDQQS